MGIAQSGIAYVNGTSAMKMGYGMHSALHLVGAGEQVITHEHPSKTWRSYDQPYEMSFRETIAWRRAEITERRPADLAGSTALMDARTMLTLKAGIVAFTLVLIASIVLPVIL